MSACWFCAVHLQWLSFRSCCLNVLCLVSLSSICCRDSVCRGRNNIGSDMKIWHRNLCLCCTTFKYKQNSAGVNACVLVLSTVNYTKLLSMFAEVYLKWGLSKMFYCTVENCFPILLSRNDERCIPPFYKITSIVHLKLTFETVHYAYFTHSDQCRSSFFKWVWFLQPQKNLLLPCFVAFLIWTYTSN